MVTDMKDFHRDTVKYYVYTVAYHQLWGEGYPPKVQHIYCAVEQSPVGGQQSLQCTGVYGSQHLLCSDVPAVVSGRG